MSSQAQPISKLHQSLLAQGIEMTPMNLEEQEVEAPSRETLKKYGLQTLQQIVEVEYQRMSPIVEPLMSPGETCLLIARQKEGKSTLALQLAVDISRGEPFLGQYKTTQSLVVYIDYENRPYRLKERAIDVSQGRSLSGVVLKTFNNIAERDMALVGQDRFAKLAEMVAEIKPAFLIIDPLRLAIDRDSSDERTAVEALDQAASLRTSSPGMAILLVHHVKKNQENLTLELRTDARSWIDKIYGSQALLAHAENIWGLEHDERGYAFGTVSRSEESFVVVLEKEPGSQRFKLSEESAQIATLPEALRDAWAKLPAEFSRSEGIQAGAANSTLDRLIRQTMPMGLLVQDPKTKRYRKVNPQKLGVMGKTQ